MEVLVTIDQVGTLLKKEGEYRLEMDNNKRIIFCDGKGVNYLFEEEEYYIDSNGEKVVTSPERKPDPLTLNEFVKITLIRSKNKPQTAPSIAEYPISGGNPEPLTLKNNIDKSATELEVNEEPSGYGVNDLIKIDSEILKITKIDKKTLTFDRHEDTDVENHYAGSYIYLHRDQSKWYADKKGDDLVKGMAEKQENLEKQMNLAQFSMLGNTQVQGQQVESNPIYYHTLIITDLAGTSTEWQTTIDTAKSHHVPSF